MRPPQLSIIRPQDGHCPLAARGPNNDAQFLRHDLAAPHASLHYLAGTTARGYQLFLIYFDEVKHDPPVQEAQLFGGITVRDTDAQEIEDRMNELAEKYFGSKVLSKDTEFHAKDIAQGKGNCKTRKPAERVEMLEGLLDILGEPSVSKIYARMTPSKVHFPTDPERDTFMLFVEKIESFLKSRSDIGMLFGDYDHKMISPSITNLSQYRIGRTSWALGRNISCLVDTVHFAHSHHSRLVQLADIYVYCTQYAKTPSSSYWRTRFYDAIRSKSGSLWPAKYRDYPMS